MVKKELGDRFASDVHARRKLLAYMQVFYNHRRIYSTLGMKSPAQFERPQSAAGALIHNNTERVPQVISPPSPALLVLGRSREILATRWSLGYV